LKFQFQIERNSAKSESLTPPTPVTLTRGQRAYATLPSKTSQYKTKIFNDNKTVASITNPSNETPLAQNQEFKTVQTKLNETNGPSNTDSGNCYEKSNSNESEKVSLEDSKFWTISSV